MRRGVLLIWSAGSGPRIKREYDEHVAKSEAGSQRFLTLSRWAVCRFSHLSAVHHPLAARLTGVTTPANVNLNVRGVHATAAVRAATTPTWARSTGR